jgi:c-di-GMP-binding flagellar brake protein YcgR
MSSQSGKAPKRIAERRQRRHPRYRAEFPVSLTLFSGEGHQSIDGHCRDLSAAGIGILIAADLPLGDVMALRFFLPGSTQTWEVRAVLRYRRGYHYGFEFFSLSEQQAKTLGGYLVGLKRADSDGETQLRKQGAPTP